MTLPGSIWSALTTLLVEYTFSLVLLGKKECVHSCYWRAKIYFALCIVEAGKFALTE